MAALSVVEDQSAPELSEAPGAEDEGAPALPGRRFAHPSSSSSAGMGPPQMRDTQSNAMAGARGAGTVPVADTAWSAGAPWSTAAPGGVAASGPMGFGSGSALPPNMPGPGGHAYFPMGQGVPGGAGGSRAMAAPPPGMPMPMYFPYGAFPLHQGYAMPTGPVMGAGGYHAHMGPPGAGGSEPGQGVPSNAGPRNSSAASSGGGVDGSQQHLQMGQMPLPGWGHGVDAMPGSGPVPMPQLPHPMVPAMAIPYMAPAGQHGRPAMVLGPMGGGGPPHANAHYHDYGYSDDHGPAARQQPQPTAPAVVPGSGAALPRTGRSEEAGSASGSGRVPTDDAADGGESSGAAGGGAGSGRPRENRAGRAAGKASGGGGSGGGAKGDGSGRSRLLEEFRAHRQRSMSLSEIRGHVREFSRDQHGSRYIQQRVEVASEVEKDEAFEELEDSMGELMMDVFGNYVVQKFLDHGSARHQQALAEMMRGKVVELTLQMYGCRVVQKALEVLDGPQQAALIQELQGHILHCVRDQNGNHVVQKCIEQVPLRHMEFVVRDMYSHVAELAVHPYGCRVVQRVLEHCAKEAVRSRRALPAKPASAHSPPRAGGTAGAGRGRGLRGHPLRGPVRELRGAAHAAARLCDPPARNLLPGEGPSPEAEPAQVCQQRGGALPAVLQRQRPARDCGGDHAAGRGRPSPPGRHDQGSVRQLRGPAGAIAANEPLSPLLAWTLTRAAPLGAGYGRGGR